MTTNKGNNSTLKLREIKDEQDRIKLQIRELVIRDLDKVYLINAAKIPQGITPKQIIDDLRAADITVKTGMVEHNTDSIDALQIESVDLSSDYTDQVIQLCQKLKELKKQELELTDI